MSLISQSMKNIINGVSQQPDNLMFPSQCKAQINAWSSETEGLQKKPPTLFLKVLGKKGLLGDKPAIHLINRDENERYYVCFSGTDIHIFDLKGNSYVINGDKAYITCENPRDDLRMVTVADYTFIINKKYEIKESETYTDNNEYKPTGRALVNIRGGQYGRTLSVTINGIEVYKYALPNGSDPSHVTQMDSQTIAKNIVTQASAKPEMSGWIIDAGEGFVVFKAPEGVEIESIETTDGYAGQLLTSFINTVQTISKLPIAAPDGYKVKIVGDVNSSDDAYYVRYDAESKTWKETACWNIKTGLDASSMPQALVREADGTFTLKELEWGERAAGDNDTNPFPSFVGLTINDVFFYRNRLGLLADENIIMSRTGSYYNFFPSSVATTSDDDPIDIAASHTSVSIFHFAIPFAEELLLFGESAQFVLRADGVLSIKTIDLRLASEYAMDKGVRPFGIGRKVYFTSSKAKYSTFNRYFESQDGSGKKEAESANSHCEYYLPAGVFNIQGSDVENYMSMLTNKEPNRIYIYKYLYKEEQLVQEAWGLWEFDKDIRILADNSIGSTMYLISENSEFIYLESVLMSSHDVDFPEEVYRVYVDHKKQYVVPSTNYDADYDVTYIYIGDIYTSKSFKGTFCIIDIDGEVIKHEVIDAESDNRVVLEGDWVGKTIIVGFAYNFHYHFARFLIKKEDDTGTSTEDVGRLQLRRAWINYEKSGSFVVTVDNQDRLWHYTSNPKVSSKATVLGNVLIATDQFRFPITGDTKRQDVYINSQEVTPLNLIGCGWEGYYSRRSNSY